MHETSLMNGLMRQLHAAAVAEGARRVVSVSVWLGALTHMSAEHFAEHFTVAAAGTLAEGARLDVTVSDDLDDARAQDVVIESVEVEL